MAKKKATPKVEQPKIEKPKSFLDKPVKDFFSFNVDKEIRDTADRSRSVIDHFNRNGITVERKRKFSKSIPYFAIIILAVLFATLFVPSIFVKGIFLLIGALIMFYFAFVGLDLLNKR